MTTINDLRDTIIPKSDQLNADQLLAGPITVTVSNVSRGNSPEQPVTLHYDGDEGRPYKPCKSMRKVLIFAWGEDGSQWIGRSMTLYNKPDVKFGGMVVGGIRISHLSNIDRDISLSLSATKGKKEPYTIKRLTVAVNPLDAKKSELMRLAKSRGLDALREAWKALTKDMRQQLGDEFRDQCIEAAKARDEEKAGSFEELHAAAKQLPDAPAQPEPARQAAPAPKPDPEPAPEPDGDGIVF